MSEWVVIGGAVGVFLAGVTLWQRQKTKRITRLWKTLADELKLGHFPVRGWFTPGRISGEYEHCRVEITIVAKSSGDSSTNFTQVRTRFTPALGLGLRLNHENFITQIQTKFGVQDIQTGDKIFDDTFLIKGSDEVEVVRFLNAKVRRAILSHSGSPGFFMLDDREILWEKMGIVEDLSLLKRILRAQNRLVQQIQKERSTP